MKKGKVFILSGPSGSGKTTLFQKVLGRKKLKNKIVRTISVTTRDQRPGEKQGHDYHFVSRAMFLYKARAKHFLEYMKVLDNYYGTPLKAVRELLHKGKSVLLCIDVQGANMVKKKIPKAVTIFVTTPTFGILKKRLETRGTEDKKTRVLRLKTAKKELLEIKKYQYVIVNDVLEQAVEALESILSKETGL